MKLSRINTLLLIAIVCINGYVIVLPFLPQLFASHTSPTQVKILEQKVSQPTSKTNPAPSDNRLIIPSMGFDQPIHEGKTMITLRQGLWRRPATSTPDKGGNTVIVGHRFTYTNPRGTLYYLNKVQVGDDIGVWWSGKRYQYQVTSVSEVKPDDNAVEAPTSQAQLTIYTCTPLWLPKDRLVVVARLEHIYE